MKNEISERMLNFVHLPSFAAYLLQHIDDYTRALVKLVYEVNLPLLKSLQHLSQEEQFQFSKKLNIEFLSNIVHNNAKSHLDTITNRWLSDQFENIGRLDVDAQDVTMINYVRSKAQKKFINAYTNDPEVAYQLHSEIDDLSFVFSSKSTNDYLQVLKDKIQNEAHFSKNIIEASPGIIFIYDLVEQKELYINGRVEEITGFTPDEILAARSFIAQFCHPDDISIVNSLLQSLRNEQDGKIHRADYRLKNKAGLYHWFRGYMVVYKRDSNGKPTQILGAAFDVNVEKETSLALSKREEQLLEAQAIGKIGSYEWDILHDTSKSTPEVRKIFEVDHRQTLEEMLQKTHPEDRNKVREALLKSFKTGTFNCEYRYMAKSGVKVIDSRGVVHFDQGGKPLTLVGTLQDITERKKAEESLIKSTLELQHSNTQLQEFAFVASHDLKEPLRKIGLFSNIIMTSDWDQLPERTKINLQKISESAVRMQKLIEGVLSYSSVDGEQKKERCSLEHLLQEALSSLEFKINETGAHISSDGLPDVAAIPVQMQQLFQNLIGNALKFSKKILKPQIKITHSILPADSINEKHLQPAELYIKIEVADNGIGFNTEAAENIFGLFKRLHGRSDYEGSGLGLAICKKIVENHGGVISATSEPNVGSIFKVIFPFQ